MYFERRAPVDRRQVDRPVSHNRRTGDDRRSGGDRRMGKDRRGKFRPECADRRAYI